ncbi:hypothetical protein [Streptomyces sp. MAR4 CNX-425]|uniref:hypothetical protein n=1 Tax=Streptomyces sp. MAR4 CNX-425 TaxID=3406343 RepID=UPI003B503063
MQVNDARILRGAAIPTALAGVVASVVSSLVAGVKGGVGAAAATVVVLAFFGLGLFALQHFSRKHPELFMGIALLTYTTQILLLAVVMGLFKDTTLFSTRAFGLTVLAAALVFTAAMGRTHFRLKMPYVEPERAAGAGEQRSGSTTEAGR